MGVKENGKTSKKTVNNFNISQLCDHTVHHLVTFPETLFQFVLLKTLLKSKVWIVSTFNMDITTNTNNNIKFNININITNETQPTTWKDKNFAEFNLGYELHESTFEVAKHKSLEIVGKSEVKFLGNFWVISDGPWTIWAELRVRQRMQLTNQCLPLFPLFNGKLLSNLINFIIVISFSSLFILWKHIWKNFVITCPQRKIFYDLVISLQRG